MATDIEYAQEIKRLKAVVKKAQGIIEEYDRELDIQLGRVKKLSAELDELRPKARIISLSLARSIIDTAGKPPKEGA